MKTVAEIVSESRCCDGCYVENPKGMPFVPHPFTVPSDVAEFYSLCGGLDMFPKDDWGWRIVGPDEFLRADKVILPLAYQDQPENYDGTESEGLYVIAIRGVGPDYITIDTHPLRLGRCFDSYSGDHATDGSEVIALSFTELLDKLFYWRSEGFFWADAFYGYLGQPTSQLKLRSRLPKRGKLP